MGHGENSIQIKGVKTGIPVTKQIPVQLQFLVYAIFMFLA